jgi:hypothetical protein
MRRPKAAGVSCGGWAISRGRRNGGRGLKNGSSGTLPTQRLKTRRVNILIRNTGLLCITKLLTLQPHFAFKIYLLRDKTPNLLHQSQWNLPIAQYHRLDCTFRNFHNTLKYKVNGRLRV